MNAEPGMAYPDSCQHALTFLVGVLPVSEGEYAARTR